MRQPGLSDAVRGAGPGVPAAAAVPQGDQDAEAALGLHLPGAHLHRRVEDDAVEGTSLAT